MIEKRKFPLTPALALAAVACLGSTAGHAEEILLSQTEMFRGSQTTVSSFDVSGRGTVDVSLSDLKWPGALSSLTFAASTGGNVLANALLASSGNIDLSFDVTGPGVYSAIVAGTVDPLLSPLGLDAYSLKISFIPAVPLPASAILLLSGLGSAAFAWRGKRPLLSLPSPGSLA